MKALQLSAAMVAFALSVSAGAQSPEPAAPNALVYPVVNPVTFSESESA